MAYWVYQHLGNLSPRSSPMTRRSSGYLTAVTAVPCVRALAERAERQDGHSRFSFCSDLGPARLVVPTPVPDGNSRTGNRRIMSPEEWDWVKGKADGERSHLLMGSSLPMLLPYGMHDVEAWSEAVGDGVWGKRFKPLGEKVRTAANLDHWACFQDSYGRFEDLVIDVTSGKRGPGPDSMVPLGGDVHHCWVSEVEVPDDAEKLRTKVWRVVCSGLRKEVSAVERIVLRLGHTRAAEAVGKLLVKTTDVGMPRLRWRPVTMPHFRNQVGTLEIAGGEMGVRIEKVTGGWRKPQLHHGDRAQIALIERRFCGKGCSSVGSTALSAIFALPGCLSSRRPCRCPRGTPLRGSRRRRRWRGRRSPWRRRRCP